MWVANRRATQETHGQKKDLKQFGLLTGTQREEKRGSDNDLK